MGKYIYGIIRGGPQGGFGFTGVEGAEVCCLHYRELSAATSETSLSEIAPKRKSVLEHTTVQDRLIKEFNLTMLPMRFGLIAGSESEVLHLLEDNYPALERQLDSLSGMIEVELKVYWNESAVHASLEAESPEFGGIRNKLKTARSAVEVQMLLLEAGKLVERVTRDWQSRYAREIYEHLGKISVDAVLNEPLGVKNLLNASFLIERIAEGRFQGEVIKLDALYGNRLNIKYVGPLPPYNFVNVRLQVRQHAVEHSV